MGTGMGFDKRTLMGCIAALATMLVLALPATTLDTQLNRPLDTGVGMVAPIDLLSTLLAMVVGGWVAGPGFRWVAVALTAISWLAILAVLWLIATPASPPPMASPLALLQYNALAIALGLVLAWLGGLLGERLAGRRHAGTGSPA